MARNSCVSTEGEWVSKTRKGNTYLIKARWGHRMIEYRGDHSVVGRRGGGRAMKRGGGHRAFEHRRRGGYRVVERHGEVVAIARSGDAATTTTQ